MNIDDVEIIGGPPVLATQADVDALEAKLWIRFPVGYREYVTRLGEGVLGGTMVRIYPPWRIEKDLSRWRAHQEILVLGSRQGSCCPRSEPWNVSSLATRSTAMSSSFTRGRPDCLFILPHESWENVLVPGREVPRP